ncbi:MAG: hypothetical protein ABW277_18610 [Longimicrobiaceae bacterium]
MAFNLEVTFTGLNLFVVHKDTGQVAVLQPDARMDQNPEGHLQHPDNSKGVPHAGYLRFDLAYLGIPVPAGDPPLGQPGDPPRAEGIYRFKRQTLHFGLGADPVDPNPTLPLPEFNKIGSTLQILPDLFGTGPAKPPVMRTILSGGSLAGGTAGPTFILPQVLNAPGVKYESRFVTDITWTRSVAVDALTLTLHGFLAPGATQATIPLKPVDGMIKLKIANLCSVDPLEWTKDFGAEDINKDDEDFKWLYRLLQLNGTTYPEKLLGSPLPIPRFVKGGAGVENCIGGIIREQSFTPPVTDRV